MGRAYVVDGGDTNTNNTTMLTLTGAATVSPGLYELIISSKAAPADLACGYTVGRITTAGTGGTAKTPQQLAPGAGTAIAAVSSSISGPSGEPTYTANAVLLSMSVNQRAIGRWVAAGPTRMLVVPSTAAAGLGLLAVSPSTAFIMEACMYFEE